MIWNATNLFHEIVYIWAHCSLEKYSLKVSYYIHHSVFKSFHVKTLDKAVEYVQNTSFNFPCRLKKQSKFQKLAKSKCCWNSIVRCGGKSIKGWVRAGKGWGIGMSDYWRDFSRQSFWAGILDSRDIEKKGSGTWSEGIFVWGMQVCDLHGEELAEGREDRGRCSWSPSVLGSQLFSGSAATEDSVLLRVSGVFRYF